MRTWTGRAAKASPGSGWSAILLKSRVLGWEVGMVHRCAGECELRANAFRGVRGKRYNLFSF